MRHHNWVAAAAALRARLGVSQLGLAFRVLLVLVLVSLCGVLFAAGSGGGGGNGSAVTAAALSFALRPPHNASGNVSDGAAHGAPLSLPALLNASGHTSGSSAGDAPLRPPAQQPAPGGDPTSCAAAAAAAASPAPPVSPPWAGFPVELDVGEAARAPPALESAAAYHSSAHLFSPAVSAAVGEAAAAATAAAAAAAGDGAPRRANADSLELLRVYTDLNSSALPRGYPLQALLRTPEEAARRHAWADACVKQHPSYNLYEGAAARMHHGREMGPGSTFLSDRTLLAAHGGTLYARLAAFAAANELLRPADWRFTTGFSGPWVEDVFRRTYFKSVPYRISLASARARHALLQAQAVPDEGAEYLLFTCDAARFGRSGEGTLEAFWAAAPAGGGGACRRCSIARDAVASIGSEAELDCAALGAGGVEGGGGEWPPGTDVFPQLFLTLPYDSELFYPFVPIPPFWENLMFTVSVSGLLNGPATKIPQGAWELEMGRLRPYLYMTPRSLMREFQQLLLAATRKDVHYVTVVQRPDGPWVAPAGAYERATSSIAALAHTVVINSGGNGHVPIPLLHVDLPLLPVHGWGGGAGGSSAQAAAPSAPAANASSSASRRGSPLVLPPGAAAHSGFFGDGNSTPPISFLGTVREGIRKHANGILREALPRFEVRKLAAEGLAWVPAFANATLVFAPRGVGATSFRLYEALQLGLPALFVYDDRPWLPYLHPDAIATLGWRSYPPRPFGSPGKKDLPPAPGSNASSSSLGSGSGISNSSRSNNSSTPTPSFSSASSRKGVQAFPWEEVLHIVEVGALRAWVSEEAPLLLPRGAGGLEDDAGARAEWLAMRCAIERYRETHFTLQGVMRQVWRLLADPFDAELFCYPAKRPGASLY